MGTNADKEYRLRITGDARELGAATKKAKDDINSVTDGAKQLAGTLTGGLIGGGLVQTIETGARMIYKVIQDARQLIRDAEDLDVTPQSVQYSRNLNTLAGFKPEDQVLLRAQVNARQARSEAEAGSPEAKQAFSALGLVMSQISKMDTDQLLQEILESVPKEPSRDQRIALRTIIGEAEGASLEQFPGGGFFKDARVRQLAGFTAKTQFDEAFTPKDLAALRARNKIDLEPLARFGRGDENRATILEEMNRARAEQIEREKKSVAVQLLEIRRERELRTIDLSETANPVRRAQIRARINDLDAQKNSLTLSPPSATQLTPYQIDSYTRTGLRAFGSGDASLNLQKEQLRSIQQMEKRMQRLAVEMGVELAKNL